MKEKMIEGGNKLVVRIQRKKRGQKVRKDETRNWNESVQRSVFALVFESSSTLSVFLLTLSDPSKSKEQKISSVFKFMIWSVPRAKKLKRSNSKSHTCHLKRNFSFLFPLLFYLTPYCSISVYFAKNHFKRLYQVFLLHFSISFLCFFLF